MLRYSMLIEWSAEDQAHLVTLPEWIGRVNTPTTHGFTYEEAARRGREALEMLLESASEDASRPPEPRLFRVVHDPLPPGACAIVLGDDDEDALPYEERALQRAREWSAAAEAPGSNGHQSNGHRGDGESDRRAGS